MQELADDYGATDNWNFKARMKVISKRIRGASAGAVDTKNVLVPVDCTLIGITIGITSTAGANEICVAQVSLNAARPSIDMTGVNVTLDGILAECCYCQVSSAGIQSSQIYVPTSVPVHRNQIIYLNGYAQSSCSFSAVLTFAY